MYYFVTENFSNGLDKMNHNEGELLQFDGYNVINKQGTVIFVLNSENFRTKVFVIENNIEIEKVPILKNLYRVYKNGIAKCTFKIKKEKLLILPYRKELPGKKDFFIDRSSFNEVISELICSEWI